MSSSALLKYICNLTQGKFFPNVSNEGHVYSNKTKSTKARQLKTAESNASFFPTSLRNYLADTFPNGHVHYTSAPETRAAKHKSAGQLTLTMQQSQWTASQVAKAAEEFQVPNDMKVLLVLPEVFHQDILADATFNDGPNKGKYKYRYGKRNQNVLSMVRYQ